MRRFAEQSKKGQGFQSEVKALEDLTGLVVLDLL